MRGTDLAAILLVAFPLLFLLLLMFGT